VDTVTGKLDTVGEGPVSLRGKARVTDGGRDPTVAPGTAGTEFETAFAEEALGEGTVVVGLHGPVLSAHFSAAGGA